MDLTVIWFVLIALLLVIYSILDGFDFGVGILHLFTKNEKDKQANINAIGPFWDGNEVWLLTAGGALFAAFPVAYATVFSSYYLALTLLLVGLIFRAVSFEFRDKVESKTWVKIWDVLFGLGSFIPPLILGVGFANLMYGVNIGENGIYLGTFLDLLNPFGLIGGLLTVVLFTLHGGIFLGFRGAAKQNELINRSITFSWIGVVLLVIALLMYAIIDVPVLSEALFHSVFGVVCVLAIVASLAAIPVFVHKGAYGKAFLSSSLTIASLFILTAVALFPYFCISSLGSQYSIDIVGAASTAKTQTTMLYIAGIGFPFVIGYTIFIYKLFLSRDIYEEQVY